MSNQRSLGLIADTHGFVDPRIPAIFSGVGHILHAGDVGPESVLLELQRLAPTTAVIGNTDNLLALPHTVVIDLFGRRFLLQHIVDPLHPTPEFSQCIETARPDIVVFGHTHRPFIDWVNGKLFVNPGSAGKRRWDTQRSVAVLHLLDQGPHVELHTLPD
ncbi:MAG TPA: metallophosphoesterase family protein [Verrucomicrobiota bacterium]|nr:metallophosphoesterase family protein [Verrucomicrobiota bacterium]